MLAPIFVYHVPARSQTHLLGALPPNRPNIRHQHAQEVNSEFLIRGKS